MPDFSSSSLASWLHSRTEWVDGLFFFVPGNQEAFYFIMHIHINRYTVE